MALWPSLPSSTTLTHATPLSNSPSKSPPPHLPFLDTMVHLESDGTVDRPLYQTHRCPQLPQIPVQPPLHKSLPYSQLMRIRRICTHTADFLHHSIQLKSYFPDRGYPYDLLEDAFIRALTQHLHALLFPPPTATAPSSPTHSEQRPTLCYHNLSSLLYHFPGHTPGKLAPTRGTLHPTTLHHTHHLW